MTMQSAALAYCIDAAYPLPLAVALRSVLENWRGGDLEVHVAHPGLPEAVRARVEGALPPAPFARLRWHAVSPERVAGLKAGLHFSSANYFRLLLPELLPGVERLLYLDADTLAVDDISPLFAAFDASLPLQACRDYIGSISNPLAQLPDFARFGGSAEAPYFNSGVLLMNLARWREERLADAVIEFGRRHPETLFLADQTAINLVLQGRIGQLAPEWNTQTVHPKVISREWDVPYLPQALERAKILHFTSEWKPWSLGRELPHAARFHEVRARCAWPA